MLRLQTPLPERYTSADEDELADDDRRRQGRAGLPAVRARAPLPARRGHALGRCPGRLLRALPDRRRPDRGRVHRLLRRPLHGRVGRRPDRRPPAGAAPRPQCRVLHGGHGGHRPGGGGLGRAGTGGRRGRPDPGHLHELGRRPEGLRRPPRRRRLHVVQRPGRADVGRSEQGRGDRVLFFPDQHLGRNTGFELGYGADDMRVWNPRLGLGGLVATARSRSRRCCCGRGTARCTSASARRTSKPSVAEHPDGIVMVHPECAHDVVELGDVIGLDRRHHPRRGRRARPARSSASRPRSTW